MDSFVEHVVARGPDSDLEVVGHARGVELVEEVRAGRVAGPRDGEAEGGLAADRAGELGEHPAAGERVVDHVRVPVVARAGSRRPERSESEARPEPSGLGVHRDRRLVDDLDVVARADVAVRVGRRAGAGVAGAVEDEARGGRATGRRGSPGERVGPPALEPPGPRVAERLGSRGDTAGWGEPAGRSRAGALKTTCFERRTVGRGESGEAADDGGRCRRGSGREPEALGGGGRSAPRYP